MTAVLPALDEAVAIAPDGVHSAAPSDDAGIRALLREQVMPGSASVAFTREPSYAAGTGLAGCTDRVVVQRDGGRVVGVGHLAVHQLLRNGVASPVAYLGELRIRPGSRAAVRGIRDGYAMLAQHAAGCTATVTSIAADNQRARLVLERGRALGIPPYEPLADLATLLVPVRPSHARAAARATPDTPPARDDLTAFLAHGATAAQLTLPWHADTWAALGTHGFGPSHMVVVRDRGTIVAAAGVWDQRAFRQVRIAGYAGVLRWARPVIHAAARLGLAPPLPPPGGVVAQGAVVAPTVRDDAWWPALWQALRAHAAQCGLAWLTITRDMADPQWPAVQRAAGGRVYRTRLYDVRWPGASAASPWDGRPFRPETGLL